MSIIDRYIRREILRLFLPMLGLLAAIFISFTSAVQIKQAVAGAIPGSAVLQLILLNTLIALEVLLPTTLFFGSIAALGRMQKEYETLTMLSAGITPVHMIFAVIKLAFWVALAAALLSVFARPWAYKLSYQLESETMAKLDIEALTPRRFVDLSAGGYTLYTQSVNRQEGYLDRVFLRKQGSSGSNSRVIISARQARLLPLDLNSPPVLQFTDGHLYRLDPDSRRDVLLDFNNLRVQLPEEEKLTEYRRNAVPTATLALSTRAKDIAEYQWRLVTPFLTLFLAALTVPLTTARPRQSRSISIAFALLIYALTFGITSVIRTAVEQERIGTMPGMWLAPLFAASLLAAMALATQFKNRMLAHR